MSIVRNLLLSTVLAVLPLWGWCAPKSTETSSDIFEMTMDENLATPKVPTKQSADIKAFMREIASSLQKKGYHVEEMRQGEVVIVIVPTDEMFAPNDSTLYPKVGDRLTPLLGFINAPQRFKVVMTVHTDDTGSESHQMELSEGRVAALYDWFDRYAKSTAALVGYPMGGTEPLKPNNSRLGRAANRRVEFFLIPGQELINLAKKGQL